MGSYQQIRRSTFKPPQSQKKPKNNLQRPLNPSAQQRNQMSLEEMREMRHKLEAAGTTLTRLSHNGPVERPPEQIQTKSNTAKTGENQSGEEDSESLEVEKKTNTSSTSETPNDGNGEQNKQSSGQTTTFWEKWREQAVLQKQQEQQEFQAQWWEHYQRTASVDSNINNSTTQALQRQLTEEQTNPDSDIPRTVSESPEEISQTVAQFESKRIEEFTNKEIFGQPEAMAAMQQRIHAADQATGMKSAIVYLMVQNEEGAQQGIDIVVIPGAPQYSPIHQFKPIDWKSQLQSLLVQFRNIVKKAPIINNIRRSKRLAELAKRLYEAMIQPVEKTLNSLGVNHLHLVLDKELQTIPVAALSDGKDYLIQKFSLSVSPSFSLTETKPINQEKQDITALGESIFEDSNSETLLGIPPEVNEINQTESEDGTIPEEYIFNLENLREYLQQQSLEPEKLTQLENSLVSLNRLQQIFAQQLQPHPQKLEKISQVLQFTFGEEQASQILHIATHGKATGGESSYLETRTGRITIKDLLKLNFSAIEMVVVSGCDGLLDNRSDAPQNQKASDREFGIGGAILEQEAESVVSSLWVVDDTATMSMMRTFYQILSQQRGLTRAQLLQEAQLAMIENRVRLEGNGSLFVYEPRKTEEEPNPQPIVRILPAKLRKPFWNFQDPYFWSAFELLGNAY